MPDQEWRIGQYVVDPTPFGHGSFGSVHNARRVTDGLRVAVKLVVLTDEHDGADKIAAERRGAMLQEQFERAHGMVPKVYDYGPHERRHLYIAMEFIPGGSLAAHIRKGPLAPAAAAEYAILICDFLDKAHQFETTIEGETYERIVHADLKPHHVLIPRPGEIKVLDFGIAKALAKTRLGTTNNWGTVLYASPDYLESGRVNEHVDFWAVGVMLYEMLSGQRPYSHLEDHHRNHRVEHAIRTNVPREPLPPSCPTDLAAIIDKILAYQVDRRYPTAAAITSDLQAFVAGAEPAATREYATAPTMPIGRSVMAPWPPTRSTAGAPPPKDEVQREIPPTDPLPIRLPLPPAMGTGAPNTTAASIASVAVPPRAARGRHTLRRLVWVGALLCFVALVATEGAAWIAAERFRDEIDALDGPVVAQQRQGYDRIRGWSIFDVGLRVRVNRRLKDRLVRLADGVIADYRREEPTMGPLEWQQADDALRWALELSPGDSSLLAKKLVCDAHLTRFAAQKQPRGSQVARQTYSTAIEKFRRAAALDTGSFDPYLGISRIEVYGLSNVDGAAAAIAEAQHRGYQSGSREPAQLGDGYLTRAEKSWKLARALSGDERRRELERAQVDYGRCIESFSAIVGFGRAAQNLEFCKRRLDAVGRELATGSEKPEVR